jgi:hypothetical protein
MLKLLIPMAIAALFVHQLAQAQEPGAGVNERQHRQMDRIRDGAASGDLTRGETRGLVGEQRAIRREESAYRSDGVVTPRERADLHRDLDRSSNHIWQQRHDAQQRPHAGGDGLSIDEREARQREAIRRGVASGELTRHEADRLRSEQMRIERMEQRAGADGRFTPQERARINRQLDNSGRHIRRETHDRQRAGGHDSGWHRGSWQGQHNGRQFGQSPRTPHSGQQSGRFQRSSYQGHSFGNSQRVAHAGPRYGRR